MRQSAMMFETNGLKFEGIVTQTDETTDSVPGVVICHPGPLNGGNMDNNVVLAVSFALVEAGFATLRFNFRGVGNSQGIHSRGELEYQEALGALEFLGAWPGVDSTRLGLAGYSFGTSIILGNVELQNKAQVYALISPSIERLEKTALTTDERPKLVISGELDSLIQSPQLQSVLESFVQPFSCRFVAGADHYWLGREEEVALQVSRFFSTHLT